MQLFFIGCELGCLDGEPLGMDGIRLVLFGDKNTFKGAAERSVGRKEKVDVAVEDQINQDESGRYRSKTFFITTR